MSRQAKSQRHRTCVGCRQKRATTQLCRVVATSEGKLGLGAGAPGRGAWLCHGQSQCFELAVKRKAFGRALRVGIAQGAAEGLAVLLAGEEASVCEDRKPTTTAEHEAKD